MTYRTACILLCLAPLAACDGGGGADDAGPTLDAGSALEMSVLFGPCEQDSQCPGRDAVCRPATAGFPGGYCTVPCADRTPCDAQGVYHHCAAREGETQRYCERRCLNGFDCGREGYTCIGELPPSGGYCIGVCDSDEQCGAGLVCDRYSTTCVEAASEVGAITGEACAEDSDCRSGACVREQNSEGTPTGWVGGYCRSNCTLPRGYNNSSFYAGDELPNGGCAGAAICLPADFAVTALRDLGTCYHECRVDEDCRAGYTCLTEIALGMGRSATYNNGLCVPADCDTEGCPDGYRCQPIPDGRGGTRNVCGS